jgi:hypothetical protein
MEPAQATMTTDDDVPEMELAKLALDRAIENLRGHFWQIQIDQGVEPAAIEAAWQAAIASNASFRDRSLQSLASVLAGEPRSLN